MPGPYSELLKPDLPPTLYVATYDISGVNAETGEPKPTRMTGIVTHTNQLVEGLTEIRPDIDITVSQTGSPEAGSYQLRTPEGQVVRMTGVNPKHPSVEDPRTGAVVPELVRFHFETEVHNPDNPVWQSIARQYAADVQRSGAQDLVLQNPNPLVGMLRAEDEGLLSPAQLAGIRATMVLHDDGNDTAGYQRRFEYITSRLGSTWMDVEFIAISKATERYLHDQGVPPDAVSLIPNGINIERFDAGIARARELGSFATVAARDSLPGGKKMILSTARRIRWKGHMAMIGAARLLRDRGQLDDAYIAFAGKSLTDSSSTDYEAEVAAEIRSAGLEDSVFMLDTVTPDELAGCYDEAYLSLLPSIRPEGIPYSSFESMLAGVPLISSRLGGPLDYIEHGVSGLFVEPNDSADLAQAMEQVLTSPELHNQLATGGRARAEEFSHRRMAAAYANVITRQHRQAS